MVFAQIPETPDIVFVIMVIRVLTVLKVRIFHRRIVSRLPLPAEICPKAFDVLNTFDDTPRRTIQLVVGLESGKLEGKMEFFYNNASVLMDANPKTFTTFECTKAIKRMKGIKDAVCVNELKGDGEASEWRYTISFLEWTMEPYENNIFFHEGNPPLDHFGCSVDRVNEFVAINPYCRLSDIVSEGSAGGSHDIPLYLIGAVLFL